MSYTRDKQSFDGGGSEQAYVRTVVVEAPVEVEITTKERYQHAVFDLPAITKRNIATSNVPVVVTAAPALLTVEVTVTFGLRPLQNEMTFADGSWRYRFSTRAARPVHCSEQTS